MSNHGRVSGAEPPSLGALRERARIAVAELVARGSTLAVAESLTGGLVSTLITDVPGASAVFRGAVVPYATGLKAELLGVPNEVLERHGAVDPQVAAAMARGVRRRLGADLGVATTGVAGPELQDAKPVGTVYVAVDSGDGCAVRSAEFEGSRADVRQAAAGLALSILLERLGT